jgi:hypothetical protein
MKRKRPSGPATPSDSPAASRRKQGAAAADASTVSVTVSVPGDWNTSLRAAREGGKLLDATVRAGGIAVRAHKVVLLAHSPYLDGLFTSGLAESTASSAEVDGSKYGVWAIPATVDASDGQIDLVRRVGLVRATTRGDEREFRRRVAAWVGRVAADMAAEGSTEAEIAEFRKGGSLFFAKIGVGTKSFAFAGRAATASASRYELYFRPSSDLAIEVQNMMFRGSEMPIIAYWPAADDSSSCFLYYFSAGMVLASPAQFVVPAGLPTAAAPKTVKAPAAVAAVVALRCLRFRTKGRTQSWPGRRVAMPEELRPRHRVVVVTTSYKVDALRKFDHPFCGYVLRPANQSRPEIRRSPPDWHCASGTFFHLRPK